MKLVTYAWLAIVVALTVASIRWIGLAGWMAVVVLTASVAMHVAGNAIGTSLRSQTDQEVTFRHLPRGFLPVDRQRLPESRRGRLSRKEGLGSVLPVSAIVGALCGALMGAGALAWLVGASVAGVVIGGISSAVIGGIAGFLCASFVSVVKSAIGEAASAHAAESPLPNPDQVEK